MGLSNIWRSLFQSAGGDTGLRGVEALGEERSDGGQGSGSRGSDSSETRRIAGTAARGLAITAEAERLKREIRRSDVPIPPHPEDVSDRARARLWLITGGRGTS